MQTDTLRYTYRLRPGAQATAALEAEWHRCRWLWNECVYQRKRGFRPDRSERAKMLTEARRRNTWLRSGWQNAQANMLEDYYLALKASKTVRGRGKPRVKKRHKALPSLNFTRNGFALVDGRLRLPKGTLIPVVWSRELPSDPTSVRVFRDNLGHWYASFVVRRERAELPPSDAGIGIDWGVSTPASTTDKRFDLGYAGHRKRCAAERATHQRRMARRKRPKGVASSKGYRRAKLANARIEKKAQRQNTHDSRVWAKRVVDAHGLIAVEDFKPAFLSRSTMARKASDIAIGGLKRELICRAERAGRKVVIVAPAYTTMTCSKCFARNKRLELCERTFSCHACGYTAGRDENAARVILVVAESGHARVEDVSQRSLPLSGCWVRLHSERENPPLSSVGKG